MAHAVLAEDIPDVVAALYSGNGWCKVYARVSEIKKRSVSLSSRENAYPAILCFLLLHSRLSA